MPFIDLFKNNNTKAQNEALQARVSELEQKLSDLGYTEYTQAQVALDKLNNEIASASKKLSETLAQAEDAYNSSFRAGILYEKAQNNKEWSRVFQRMGLRNRYSNSPILTLEDYYKWEAEDTAVRRERQKKGKNEADNCGSIEQVDLQTPLQKLASEPNVHYLFVTKSDSAFETILEFAYSIFDKVNRFLPNSMLDPAVYIISSALCTWAELFLKQKKDWSDEIIEMLAADYGDRADALKEAMLSAADTVRSLLCNLDMGSAMPEFASVLKKLLMIDDDAIAGANLYPTVISFSTSYITNMKHCV